MYSDAQTGPSVPEEVVPFHDAITGVRGAIVLHSTALGPAAGGCRLARYPSDKDAVADALRLAEGMAWKNALADLPLGGGKMVLCATDPLDRTALFRAVGRAVEALGGRYVTAEDVGTSVADMDVVAQETRHVAGRTARPGRAGGDPSPWTALGVLNAMRVAVRYRLDADLSDMTVAVQGLGHVGYALCELLHEAGARLLIAEPRSHVAAQAAVRFGATVVNGTRLSDVHADVFAPCALGGVLDAPMVRNLRAKVVCGAANNQLFSPFQAEQLADRGILYAPDFLVNAGGIINVAAEHLGWDESDVRTRIDQIGARLNETLHHADRFGVTPHEAARRIAVQRMAANRVTMAAAA